MYSGYSTGCSSNVLERRIGPMQQQQADNCHVTALGCNMKQCRRLIMTQESRYHSRDFYGIIRHFPGIIRNRRFSRCMFCLQVIEYLLNGRYILRLARRVQHVVQLLICTHTIHNTVVAYARNNSCLRRKNHDFYSVSNFLVVQFSNC